MAKSIVIIGAGPGNGMAIARRFGSQGFAVALISRSAGKGSMSKELYSLGITSAEFQADTAHPETVASAVAKAASSLGAVEVLVFNAAAVTFKPVLELTAQELIKDFTAGVASVLAAIHALAPDMMKHQKGSILLTGGGFAFRPNSNLASLGVQKASIRNLAMSLADELGPKGVRVATVTIMGMIKSRTAFDPDKIADVFYALHEDRSGSMGVEFEFKG
jgi:short-subunit dehydrogenase